MRLQYGTAGVLQYGEASQRMRSVRCSCFRLQLTKDTRAGRRIWAGATGTRMASAVLHRTESAQCSCMSSSRTGCGVGSKEAAGTHTATSGLSPNLTLHVLSFLPFNSLAEMYFTSRCVAGLVTRFLNSIASLRIPDLPSSTAKALLAQHCTSLREVDSTRCCENSCQLPPACRGS